MFSIATVLLVTCSTQVFSGDGGVDTDSSSKFSESDTISVWNGDMAFRATSSVSDTGSTFIRGVAKWYD